MPTLGSAIGRILKLSASEDESIRQLSHSILCDVSLTQKILRLSNSIAYRSTGGKTVTNITHAIFLLGFETVRTCALAVLLVDKILADTNADFVRFELIHGLTASMISQELVKQSQFYQVEEVAIAALFKNMGRLLLAAYKPDKYQEIMHSARTQYQSPEQAARELFALDLNDFTETILGKWNIPTNIIQTIKGKSPETLNSAKNKKEWIKQVVEFSDFAAHIPTYNASEQLILKEKVLHRFDRALNLDMSKLDELLKRATEETNAICVDANLFPTEAKDSTVLTYQKQVESEEKAKDDILAELALMDEGPGEVQIIQRHPSGKPYNSVELLLAAIQEVTEIIANGNYKLGDLMLLILECYYNSLGLQFITLCLKDVKENQYRARTSFGKNSSELQKSFHFPITPSVDLFYLAMEKGTDLLISNAKSPKVNEMLPQWYLNLLPHARSFIVLPLVLNKKAVGFIYGDREFDAPEQTPPEETRLIKMLKSQLLTILNTK